jgi:RNA polymerase sigma factor (sigma-70 family)
VTAQDDYELLTAWRAGDHAAGDQLVRRYYGSIMRFFELRTRAAEDLTQRTLLACVEGRERFRGDSTFRAYLFGIARRQLSRHIEHSARDEELSRFEPMGTGAGTSVSMLVARAQEHQLLLQAMQGLAEEAQTVVALYYWEGLQAKEIADVLEVPTSTVTTRLARAREQLRRRVERLGRFGRAGHAVLADLEGWVRSLADPHAARAGQPAFSALAGRHPGPRKPGDDG